MKSEQQLKLMANEPSNEELAKRLKEEENGTLFCHNCGGKVVQATKGDDDE